MKLSLSHCVLLGLLSTLSLSFDAHAEDESVEGKPRAEVRSGDSEKENVGITAKAIARADTAKPAEDEWGAPPTPKAGPTLKAKKAVPAPKPDTEIKDKIDPENTDSDKNRDRDRDKDKNEAESIPGESIVAPDDAPVKPAPPPAAVKRVLPVKKAVPVAAQPQTDSEKNISASANANENKDIEAPVTDKTLAPAVAPKAVEAIPKPARAMRAKAPVPQPAGVPLNPNAATNSNAAVSPTEVSDAETLGADTTNVRETRSSGTVSDELKNRTKNRMKPSDVGLSVEQTNAILDIRKKAQSDLEKRLTDELKTAKLDMNTSMVDATPGDDVRKKFELVQKKYLELQRIKFERTLKIREVLSVEQRKKLQGFKSSH
ncbi:MAG: hypothetical protein H7249_01765 [Chitinophagaceae bacterium]|nr:hypothetical protein [Oligoflexus sp.]